MSKVVYDFYGFTVYLYHWFDHIWQSMCTSKGHYFVFHMFTVSILFPILMLILVIYKYYKKRASMEPCSTPYLTPSSVMGISQIIAPNTAVNQTSDFYITPSTEYVVWNLILVGSRENNLGSIYTRKLSNLISLTQKSLRDLFV